MKAYYMIIPDNWADGNSAALLKTLPEPIIAKINKYKTEDKKIARLTGYLLLKKYLNDEYAISKEALQFSSEHSVYINRPYDCSISYGNGVIACAYHPELTVGIDIVALQNVNPGDYEIYFKRHEWQLIQNNAFPANKLLQLWSRKEALLKAVGAGFYTDDLPDCSAGNAVFDNKTYYFYDLELPAHFGALAAARPIDELLLQQLEINDIYK